MNKNGFYEYGVIGEGGYFGDISILFDTPSEYGYFFDPHCEKPLMMLAISAKKFQKICDRYPITHELFYNRAK